MAETKRPKWKEDKEVSKCRNCESSFGLLTRKHHCRCCGDIFCDPCSANFVEYPPSYGYIKPERICKVCLPNKLFPQIQELRESRGLLRHQLLTLSTGRVLAFTVCGAKDGFPTFLFHGAYGVGDATGHKDVAKKHGVMFIAVTLPGWGFSEAVPNRKLKDWPKDILEVSNSLNINGQFDVMGISFGCIHAMSVAALCPERVRKMMLLGPHAPLEGNLDWFEGMDMQAKILFGWVPKAPPAVSNLFDDMAKKPLSEDPVAFINKYLLADMSDSEKKQWDEIGKEKQNELLDSLSTSMRESIYYSAPGLSYGVSYVLLQPWGFVPESIKSPTFIVSCSKDKLTPPGHARYLADKIPTTKLKLIDGGHLTLVFQTKELYEEFFTWDGQP